MKDKKIKKDKQDGNTGKIGKGGKAKEERIPKPLVDRDWKGAICFVVPMYNEIVSIFVGDTADVLYYFRDAKTQSTLNMMAKIRFSRDTGCPIEGMTLWDGGSAMIRLPYLDLGDQACVKSLYHEALHVALLTLRRVGVEIGEYGEALAYLQGYIVDSMIEELKSGRYGTLLPDGRRIPASPDAAPDPNPISAAAEKLRR